MEHNHKGHQHHHATKNIGFAFIINLSFTILEIIGGILTNSVAIISDAIHDLGDSVALGTSWYLEKKSNKKPNKKFTFGYRRLSIISAFINCIILLVGGIIVLFEAIKRLFNPEIVNINGMIYLAILGVIVNSWGAWKVIGGKTLNEKIISWHLIEDVLGWLVVLIGSIVMYFYPLFWIDSVLSILTTLFITYKVIGRFKQSFYLLAQTVPNHINLRDIENNLLKIPQVSNLHDTNLWSLDEETHFFSSHIVITHQDDKILNTLKETIKKWNIEHITIQIETEENICNLKKNKTAHNNV